MNWNKIIYRSCCWLGIGLLSCTRIEPDIPVDPLNPLDPTTMEQGFLTFNMKLPGNDPIQTKVDDGSGYDNWGRMEENFVHKVRLVLYGFKIIGMDESENPVYDQDEKMVVRYAFDFNIQSKVEEQEEPTWDEQNNPVTITTMRVVGYQQYFRDEEGEHVLDEGADAWYEANAPGKPHLYESIKYTLGKTDQYVSFITWARQVAIDDYKMLLIINPTTSEYVTEPGTPDHSLDICTLTEPGRSLDEIREAITITQENLRDKSKYGFAEDKYFLMTNTQDLVDVPRELLMPTEQFAHDNPVPVYVSRVVAKITVSKQTTGTPFHVLPDGATVTDFRFGLDASNKKSYWMRKMTDLINENGAGKGDMETQLTYDPYDPVFNSKYHLRLQAIDPNYEGVTDMGANFNYLEKESPELPYFWTGEIPGDASGDDFAYCLENTMYYEDNAYPKQLINQSDQLTTVWISYKYAPPGIENGTSYYVWGNVSITPYSMEKFIDKPNSIPEIPAYNGLKAAIEDAEKEKFNLQAQDKSFHKYGIKYYHNGVNYYPVVIRHATESLTEDGVPGYGYYAVVRNIHYDISVSSITGHGQPTLDPEIETEDSNGNLKFEITLNKWQNRGQYNVPGPVRPPQTPN